MFTLLHEEIYFTVNVLLSMAQEEQYVVVHSVIRRDRSDQLKSANSRNKLSYRSEIAGRLIAIGVSARSGTRQDDECAIAFLLVNNTA